MPKIYLNINDCEECPHSKSSRVYTSDSFEDVRKVYCEIKEQVVHAYLEWRDDSPVPDNCPLLIKESKPNKQIVLIVKEPDSEILERKGDIIEFTNIEDFNDYLVESLRSVGASIHYISYVDSEIKDLKLNEGFIVVFQGEEIFTVTKELIKKGSS